MNYVFDKVVKNVVIRILVSNVTISLFEFLTLRIQLDWSSVMELHDFMFLTESHATFVYANSILYVMCQLKLAQTCYIAE